MARTPQDEKARFLSKVKEISSGCHEWQSVVNRGGYGKFYFRGKQDVAHRVAYQLFKGNPQGQWVLHKCDNRLCVNPEHLFLGDAIDNIKDMDSKGRRGTKCPLTEDDARTIKALLAQGISQQKIANAYGVHQTAISRVKLDKITIFLKE